MKFCQLFIETTFLEKMMSGWKHLGVVVYLSTLVLVDVEGRVRFPASRLFENIYIYTGCPVFLHPAGAKIRDTKSGAKIRGKRDRVQKYGTPKRVAVIYSVFKRVGCENMGQTGSGAKIRDKRGRAQKYGTPKSCAKIRDTEIVCKNTGHPVYM